VIISSDIYNQNKRETLLIIAISSQIENRLTFESEIIHWEDSGLLKASIFKSSIATIEKDYIITRLGSLKDSDIKRLEKMIEVIC